MRGFLTFDPTEGALRIAGLNQQNAMIGSMVLGVVNPRQWASKAVKKLTSKGLVDLTEHRAAHILNRHSAGVGISGKTEFPARWADDEVLHHVSDVATDPSAVTGLGKWNSPYAIGTRDGVTIRVDFYTNDHATYAGKISTAYPINVPPNP